MKEIIDCHANVFPFFLEQLSYQGVGTLRDHPAWNREMHTIDGQKVVIETSVRFPTPDELAHWTPSCGYTPPIQ